MTTDTKTALTDNAYFIHHPERIVHTMAKLDTDPYGKPAMVYLHATIAHRLTTIKDYDRILVLGEEGIVESGTHDQLLAKQGVYYRLWNQLPGEDTL